MAKLDYVDIYRNVVDALENEACPYCRKRSIKVWSTLRRDCSEECLRIVCVDCHLSTPSLRFKLGCWDEHRLAKLRKTVSMWRMISDTACRESKAVDEEYGAEDVKVDDKEELEKACDCVFGGE